MRFWYHPSFMWPPEKSWIAMNFAESIAVWSRFDAQMPDPHAEPPRGRECYAWTPQEDHAFDIFETEMSNICFKHWLTKDIDYTLYIDAVGNMFFTILGKKDAEWERAEVLSNEPGFIMGSHLDSTPNGGMYDGVIWVGSGMEAINNLLKNGKPKKSITLVAWRWEESSPNNGVGCLGSQIATGQLSMEQIEKIVYRKDKNGEDILFLQHLADKNWVSIESMREDIRKMILESAIFNQDYALWIEIHVEQSGVIDKQEKDLGIVNVGIGWAKRERWEIDISQHEKTYNKNNYRLRKIQIKGNRGHTGGTPPNPAKRKSELKEWQSWYRDDALVGLSAFLGSLPEGAIVREIWYGSPLGFTSIPDDVYVDVAFPKESEHTFFETLESTYWVKWESKKVDITDPSFAGYTISDIKDFLSIPLSISHIATERMQSEIWDDENAVWVSRVTVADMKLADRKITFNLDYRHVWKEETFQTLIDSVKKKVNGVTITPVSYNLSARISDAVVDLLKKWAEKLWYSYVVMPSLPGHDIAYVGKTWVPVAMIFVRHDGISHNPREHMDSKSLKKPLKLLEEVLRDFAY